MAAHQAPHPWDSPGKNSGVGCHFLLQYMKVKTESEVAQSRPTLSDPMDCSPPGFSIHGIFQARVLEWGRQTLTDIKGEIDSNTIIVGNSNTPLIPMDRSSKQKINKETQFLNDALDEMDLIFISNFVDLILLSFFLDECG